mgnify:CR=1 FL=1
MASPIVFDTRFQLQENVKRSFAANLVRYAPFGTAPLFALTNMVGTKKAIAPEHGYFTKEMVYPQAVVTAAVTAAATTIVVDNIDYFLPGQVFKVFSTGENIAINTIAEVDGNFAITVTREFGEVPAAPIAADALIYQIGTAFEEASLRPQALNIQPAYIRNFTQIFRNSWGISATVDATENEVGNGERAENRTDCGILHSLDIEKTLLFGQKSIGTRNNQVIRTADGLESVIRQYAPGNISTAGATTSYDQLEAMLDSVFNVVTDVKVANERVLFVGATANKVINKIGRNSGQYQIIDGATNFGVQFKTFKISRGQFRIIEHPLFNTNPLLSQMAMAVDLSSFDTPYLRKTSHKGYGLNGEEAPDGGIDAIGGTLTTELTTQITNPSANAIIYGLTDAAPAP